MQEARNDAVFERLLKKPDVNSSTCFRGCLNRTSFRRRVSVAVQAGRRFADVFPWLFKPDVVSPTCFRDCSSRTSFRRRVSVAIILFSRWSCGLSDELRGDYCGFDFEIRLYTYVDISWSRRHPPPLLRCRSLPVQSPCSTFRLMFSGYEFLLNTHLNVCERIVEV